MRRQAGIALLCLACGGAPALGRISLNLASISAPGIKLEGLRVVVNNVDGKAQPLHLSVAKLSLPPPFDKMSFFELQCGRFSFGGDALSCRDGQAKIASPWLNAPEVRVDFESSKTGTTLSLDKVKFAGGTLSLKLSYAQKQWQALLSAQHVGAKPLQSLISLKSLKVDSGKLSVVAKATGHGANIGDLQADIDIQQLNAQSGDGRYASEKLQLSAQLQGRIDAGAWRWQQQIRMHGGALYAEPVYIAAGHRTLTWRAHAQWLPQQQRLKFQDINFEHADLGRLQGNLCFQQGSLQDGDLDLRSEHLDKFAEVYLYPFFTATALEGLGFAGQFQGHATFTKQRMTRLDLNLPQLQISDEEQRFVLQNGAGDLHWVNSGAFPDPSVLLWDRLTLYGLPFGKETMVLRTYANSVRLLNPMHIPFFDGTLRIGSFNWRRPPRPDAEPEVQLQADIHQVALAKLTDHLHWPPLAGELSGHIPGVHYGNKQAAVDGTLKIRLFDGSIGIENILLAGFLDGMPRLNADIHIDNLDLQQITQRFPFGGMQGRLAGSIRDLVLENWQPVTFFAWLGTPEHDDSAHRISQKAVNSIASIGGSATDLLSRGLLRLFDSFGYDKLGIGCYLHRGVCQLSGVAVAPGGQGFYMVKGGGLPRIDVIGYNPRIDWQVLLQRLRRVMATDKVIVE